MSKKLCEVCGVNKATIPDRNRQGRPINRLCSECHGKRLAGDFAAVAEAAFGPAAKYRSMEIVGPDGKVHYRRPDGHPDIAEALSTPGYSVRPEFPDEPGTRETGNDRSQSKGN